MTTLVETEVSGISVSGRAEATLRLVDERLEAARTATGDALHRQLDELVAAILDHCELGLRHGGAEVTVEDVFADNLAQRHRRFAAITLLRLLATNAEPFDDGHFRVAAFQLFETALPDLYQALRIDTSWQTYKKQQHLADAAPAAEAALARVTADLRSFQDLPQFRQDVMRTLNGAAIRPILSEFIPTTVARNALNAALAAAAEVVEAPEHERVDAYRRALDSLKSLRDRATAVGTDYCCRLVVPLVNRVQAVLDDEVAEIVGRAASISVSLAEKKYPLHVDAAAVQIQFALRNDGPGTAYNVELRMVSTDGLAIAPADREIGLGNWPVQSVIVPVAVVIEHGKNHPAVEVAVSWKNADGSQGSVTEVFVPEPQRPDVDWDALADPYSLDAVANEELLVGRDEILHQLASVIGGESMGSSIISGQKRVGKTSIARTFEARLERNAPDVVCAYLEIGGYGGGDIPSTIRRLGPAICRRFASADPALGNLSIPEFDDGSFAPVIEFFEQVRARLSGRRNLLILDEFDELSSALFSSDDNARSFFLTLRTLTSEPDFAVILVGGEKMRPLLAAHGDTLNRFENFPVDYFDATNNWADFSDLVRKPAMHVLEYSDDAVAAVYEAAAGHPFFAKMICQQVAREALRRRDAHVTRPDIEAATHLALASAPAARFQHFWTDGISASDDRRDFVKATRVKLLLALAQALRRESAVTEDVLIAEAKRFNLTDSDAQARLREFMERGILIEDRGNVKTRIPFFGEWLREYGPREIVTELSGDDPVVEERRREEEAQVRPEEIVDLLARWGSYRGTPVTSDTVRAWLAQFEDVHERRLMFQFLEGVDFYSTRRLEEIFEGLHSRTLKRTQERRASEGLTRADILVSYFGGAGKSGAEMARLYRRVNDIGYDNVVEAGAVVARLGAGSFKAVVFVDDFVGSGESLAGAIDGLDSGLFAAAVDRGVDLYIAIAVGFEVGFALARDKVKSTGHRLRLLEGNSLRDEDKVFSDATRYFVDANDRIRAEAIAARIGASLEPEHPLGFEDSQAGVVFATSCPNNSLPILWGSRGGWRPLFPRR